MATFLTIPPEIRQHIYEEMFDISTSAQRWLLPIHVKHEAMETAECDPNDSDSIDSYIEQPKTRLPSESGPRPIPDNIKDEMLRLFMRRAPALSLRLTSKSIFHESSEAYEDACSKMAMYRKQLFAVFVSEGRQIFKGKGGFGRELLAGLASRAVMPMEGNEKYCPHICEKDALECFCAEHSSCFRCGRWPALAWLLESHRKVPVPTLVNGIGELTYLGRIVGGDCEMSGMEHNEFGLPTRFPCYYDDRMEWNLRIAESGWRFELERAKIEMRMKRLLGEIRESVGWSEVDSPMAKIGTNQLRRWIVTFEALEKWNRHSYDQCREPLKVVDSLYRLMAKLHHLLHRRNALYLDNALVEYRAEGVHLHFEESESTPVHTPESEQHADECCIQ